MGCRSMTDSAEKITLRRITEGERERWDYLVESSPHGTVFHTWDWVFAMAKHSRMRLFGETLKPVFHPLIAEDNGRDIGLVPLYEFKGRFVNYVFSPPPHTLVTYLGPCLNFPAKMRQAGWERLHRNFQNAVDEYISLLGAHCARIRPPPGFDDARPYLWLGYEVTPLYNYVIDLKRPVEEIFQSSESNFRNKVRRTEKEGYTVRMGSWDDVVNLYDQQKNRYGEQGMPISIELDYMRALWQNLPAGTLKIFVVEHNGKYVTGSIEACFKGRMVGWMGTTKSQSGAGSPNDLIVWEIIKNAVAQGCTEYENIWANEERLNQFKTKLNPKINRYYSVVRMNRLISFAYQIKKCLHGSEIWSA
jgi:CelD/BcsL family acetyltransferase involved in cellulose biosynthesis